MPEILFHNRHFNKDPDAGAHRRIMMNIPKQIHGAMLLAGMLCLAFAARADAYYLKKITIAPIQNESGWAERFDPGHMIADILVQKIQRSGLLVLSPPAGESAGLHSGLGTQEERPKQPTQLILRSRILQFKPGERQLPKPKLSFDDNTEPEPQKKLTAEARMVFEVVNGFTGRLFWQETYQYRSMNGEFPIGDVPASLDPFHPDFYRTAMGQVLDHMTNQILEKLLEFANTLPLEGQIVAMEMEDGEPRVFMNIGRKDGVEVGDMFRVFEVSSMYKGPLYGQDLGPWYKQLGAIRILDAQPGFAIGAVRAGEHFSKGQVVRAHVLKPVPQWKEEEKIEAITQPEPEPLDESQKAPFTSPVRDAYQAPARLSHFNLFDVVKWTFSH